MRVLLVAGILVAAGLVPVGVGADEVAVAPVTVGAEADAGWESGRPPIDAGSSSTLEVDTSPPRGAYLRFVVPAAAAPPQRAVLRLYVTNSSKLGPAVYAVDPGWDEATLSGQNRPPRRGGVVAASTGKAPSKRWLELDVTAAVGGPGPVAFELEGRSTDGVGIRSREGTSKTPELVLSGGTPSASPAPPGPPVPAPIPNPQPNPQPTPTPPGSPPGGRRPNLVVFLTDDQRGDHTMEVMPKTRRWFAQEGTTFPNGYATTPLCCPSRSGIFSGRYTHNHGNLNNQTTTNLDYQATFARYLRDAGYGTGLVGKFLLNWPNSDQPPYFDYWALSGGGYHGVSFGTDQGTVRADYTTTEAGRQALRMLDAFERDDDAPFVLYVATQAPHETWEPESRYAQADVGDWAGTPAIAETDRSDKPPWVRSSKKSFAEGADIRQHQLRTLLSVDDMVDTVMSRLDELGEGADTVAMFTSDNGYQWGEHGLVSKYHPYTQSIDVPFYVRWPGRVPAGAVDRRYVGNVDITPSLLGAAGLSPVLKYPFDGRPFLDSSGLAPPTRSEAYLEYFRDEHRSIPDWASIRTEAFQYVEYRDGERVVFREYYDLSADPFQLVNLLGDGVPGNDPDTAALAQRISVYRRCAGTAGPAPCV